jgi:hypothetical protein
VITLASDCLLFELASGESVPCSADMVSVDLEGDTADLFDPEFVRHAATAVFHYFKHELGRQTVSVGEFASALQRLLRGFAATAGQSKDANLRPRVLESDLHRLARESGHGCELLFFARLRVELQQHMQRAPRVLRFRGLRGCVKQLTGARRWSPRCQHLEGEIVAYLRQCLSAAPAPEEFALVVE